MQKNGARAVSFGLGARCERFYEKLFQKGGRCGIRNAASLNSFSPDKPLKMLAPSSSSLQDAEQRTLEIVALLPKEWRSDDTCQRDFTDAAAAGHGILVREDCKLLLQQLTRAIPLSLLLEHGKGSLNAATSKELLSTATFFQSCPVDKLKYFISHMWKNDPRETATAVMLQLKLSFILKLIVFVNVILIGLLLIFPPAAILPFPLLSYFLVATFTTKSDAVMKLLGLNEPRVWYDKSCVQQTKPCLTQVGLHLFSHYLTKSSKLMILFQPDYLTRSCCIYELAFCEPRARAARGALLLTSPLLLLLTSTILANDSTPHHPTPPPS